MTLSLSIKSSKPCIENVALANTAKFVIEKLVKKLKICLYNLMS